MPAERHCGNIFVDSNNKNLLMKISEPLLSAGYKVNDANCIKQNIASNGDFPDLVIYDFTESNKRELSKQKIVLLSENSVSFLIIAPTEMLTAEFGGNSNENYLDVSFNPFALVAKVAQIIEQNRLKSEIDRSRTRFNNFFQSGMMGIILWDKG